MDDEIAEGKIMGETPVAEGIAEEKVAPNGPAEKYRRGDGSWDTARLVQDLEESEKRVEGLRKKMSEPPKTEVVKFDDWAEEMGEWGSEEDKVFAEKFVNVLAKVGLGKEKAAEFLKELATLHGAEDPREIHRRELEKLGSQRDEILGELRRFRDGVKESGQWDDADFQAFENATASAENVMLIAKILRSANTMRGGQFSPQIPAAKPPGELSMGEKTDMYSRAYALRRTDPQAAQAELNRLKKLFES